MMDIMYFCAVGKDHVDFSPPKFTSLPIPLTPDPWGPTNVS